MIRRPLAIDHCQAVDRAATTSTPGGHTSGRAELSNIKSGKLADTGSLLLIGGGMISGSPKEEVRAELRGSDDPGNAARSETRFPAVGETWASCFYGRAGEVQLFHRVDGPSVANARW